MSSSGSDSLMSSADSESDALSVLMSTVSMMSSSNASGQQEALDDGSEFVVSWIVSI